MKKIFLYIFVFFTFANSSFASDVLVENIFSDIDSNYIYRDELQSLFDRGTIVADASWRFNPNSLLNRDEFVGISMEVICERCIQPHTQYEFIEEYFNEDVYFDIDNSNPYFYCVAEADKQNYVRWYDIWQSCQDGTSMFWQRPFCPLNTINLEEAIAVLLRNSWIFTIDDNALVVENIRNGTITAPLWNDVFPADNDGNPYTFYGYLQKALEYEITEFDPAWNSKTLRLLELDSEGNVNPQKQVTKQEFLRMSYIALKSNSCSDIVWSDLALSMIIWEDTCWPWDTSTCQPSDLQDPENTYDFEPEVQWVCEWWIDDPTGYIWRFQNLSTGEQQIKYGRYIDNHILTSPWEWRVFLRVTDTCWNSSEVYSTIFVPDWDTPIDREDTIDVDIDIYDDDCTPSSNCKEIDFYIPWDDDPEIIDLDGDVETSCPVGIITYRWTLTHSESGNIYNYNWEYLDDILLGFTGEWRILLEVVDGCGQTGSETLIYIVPETDDETWDPINYIDVDIDVYDDDCNLIIWCSELDIDNRSDGGRINCNREDVCDEIEFESWETDGDDIFDFHETVVTSCTLAGFSYSWEFKRRDSLEVYNFTTAYIDNFEFLNPWVWEISLSVIDGCNQTARDGMTYIVRDSDNSLNVSIIANPVLWYEDLQVDFQWIVSGWTPPYSYRWDFWDTGEWFSQNMTHIYTNDRTYQVLFQATDIYGLTWSATTYIIVLDSDSCEQDLDSDGIADCDDACPLVSWDENNSGCPIFETPCSNTCGCEDWYSCSIDNILSCNTWVCLPDFDPKTTCLYTPEQWWIYGNAVCSSCPCANSLDFLADVRRCDLVFPAITSPDGREIFSRWSMWQVQ